MELKRSASGDDEGVISPRAMKGPGNGAVGRLPSASRIQSKRSSLSR
jgi:hypothetical protein